MEKERKERKKNEDDQNYMHRRYSKNVVFLIRNRMKANLELEKRE